MPTARFTQLVGIRERTYRRWQARARDGCPPKGPWPAPSRDAHRQVVADLARAHPGVGAPEGVGNGPARRPPPVGLDGAADPGRGRPAPQGRLPARTPQPGPGEEGRFRGATNRPEPGVAARLLRDRDPDRRDLAGRRGRRLLVQGRVRVALVADGEPARRDRRGRARPGRSAAAPRWAEPGRVPDRSRHRRASRSPWLPTTVVRSAPSGSASSSQAVPSCATSAPGCAHQDRTVSASERSSR